MEEHGKNKKIKIKPSNFEHVNKWRGWIWVSPESRIDERSWATGARPCANQHFLELISMVEVCYGFWEKEKGKWDEVQASIGSWESYEKISIGAF